MSNFGERARRWGTLVSTFLAGQGMVQALKLIAGFLIINWLSKDSYADYTLIVAILGTTSVLVSLGFSQCLTGLIGRRVQEPKVVGRYVRACLYYRNRLLLGGAVILLGVMVFISDGIGWSVPTSLLYWALIVGSLYFHPIQAVYSPILLLQQRLVETYSLSLISSLFRISLLVFVYFMGWLSAPTAVACAIVQEMVAAFGKYWLIREQVEMPATDADVSSEKAEIRRQTLPRVPSLIFTAFSGQLVVFLIGIFGTREGIAEVGALGRLAMIFMVLQKAGGVLIGPYFAKLNAELVARHVLRLYAGMILLTISISLCVYLIPGALLWVLGDGYAHLGFEAFLVVLAALIRVSSMITFSVCNARKIVFSWFSIADVLPQLIIIATWLIFFDLSVLANVLYFGIAMAASKWFSKSLILYCGLRKSGDH